MSELQNVFASIASAIRAKNDKSEAFTPAQMINEIYELDKNVMKYSGSESIVDFNNYETHIFPNAFISNSYITSINGNYIKYIGESAFYNCSALSIASFKCSGIYNNAFENCTNLMSLYLFNTSEMVYLNSINAFNNTPLSAGGSGTIYVESSFYNDYITNSVWGLLSARISSYIE